MPVGRDPLRVALVSSSYHPYFGGVEEHVRQVAATLRARGHAVEVWTVDRGEGLGSQVVEGVTVRYLPTPLPARRIANLVRFGLTAPWAFAQWFRAARRFRPDVLHVHCFGPNGPYAMALSRVLRRPLVVTSHGETFADENDVFGRSALLRAALARACRAATVTGVSTLVADDLQRRFGAKHVAIVPNGVADMEDGVRGRRSDGRVVSVGRLVRVKGFDLLVRALPLTTRVRDVLLVGDGPERANLEQLAAELGVADRVEFLGRVPADQVRAVMEEAAVVVVPSRREAFGIVALEAWASGTPLIATSTGGPAGFVTDGTDGVLVDPEDTAALADAMDRVLASPSWAADLAANGSRAVRGFTWGRVADDYEQIYAAVTAHQTAGDPAVSSD